MNVAVTYYCNQKCGYCFGMDAMNAIAFGENITAAREMTFANLKKIMVFMKKSGVSIFSMIGGEPTLHSRFEQVYNKISANGFSILIFSNGVIDKQRVDFLREQDSLNGVLLNIRQPAEYSQRDWKKILYTLSSLKNKIILSFRIYRLDFNPVFLFDLIDQYGLQRWINWAPACPSLVRDNIFLRLEDYEQAAERMVKFSRISKKRKISWYPDSGFILCAFSNGKLEEIRRNVDFVPAANCFPAIEVAPDLKVFRCFGLASKSRPGLKITDFKNLVEARQYFYLKSLPFKRIGSMDKCFKCEHLISQKCGGGCMVHILKRFPDHKDPIF
ncbi:radical SAM protein [Candidatus Omnitrophota bacterium]